MRFLEVIATNDYSMKSSYLPTKASDSVTVCWWSFNKYNKTLPKKHLHMACGGVFWKSLDESQEAAETSPNRTKIYPETKVVSAIRPSQRESFEPSIFRCYAAMLVSGRVNVVFHNPPSAFNHRGSFRMGALVERMGISAHQPRAPNRADGWGWIVRMSMGL